jgi:hypothetical protein
MANTLRGFAALAAIALAAFALSAVSVVPAGAQDATGRVRVMHASPDTPPVDIFVDGQKAVSGLTFPDDTGYVSLPAGSHNVKVFASPADGTGEPALEADLNVVAGKDYTVLAVGLLGDSSLSLLPLEDNNAAPAAGNAHVRLIHASPDAPAVDVAVAGTDTLVFSNVAFKGVGNYTPVPAGAYDLEVRAAGNSTVALPLNGVALTAGTVYSAVAVGLLEDGSLQVVPLVDAQAAPAATPTASAPSAPTTGTGLSGEGGGTETRWLLIAGLALVVGALLPLKLATRRIR